MKVKHQRSGGLNQCIDIHTLKWEGINVDFVVRLPRIRRQHESTWVIMDRLTKTAHFLHSKVTYSAEDYAKFYFKEIVMLYGEPLSIISDRGCHIRGAHPRINMAYFTSRKTYTNP